MLADQIRPAPPILFKKCRGVFLKPPENVPDFFLPREGTMAETFTTTAGNFASPVSDALLSDVLLILLTLGCVMTHQRSDSCPNAL